MLERVLEPEVMDTSTEADDYDAMDHSAVNQQFVTDLLEEGLPGPDILDLGTGTALIPVELCQRYEPCRIMAADLSTHMLDVARYNIEIAGLIDRIQLDHSDAKQMLYADGMFHAVISNSIIHHIPDPLGVLQETLRVTSPGGLLFFRDLLRPSDEATLEHLVTTYTGDQNEHQQQMFRESLHAALTVDEMADLVQTLGFDRESVRATSDRHWTWDAHKPGELPPLSGDET